MTNSITTITRERLEEVVSHIHVAGGMRLPEIQEMARALLAVMDAKPIGYFRDDARAVFRVWPTKSDDCSVPVYTTPPAPSAPDGWIKCSDRMPDDDTLCLGCDLDGVMWTLHFDEGQLMPDIGELSSAITHWMPLPAAPGGD